MRKILFVSLFFTSCFLATAQKPVELLNNWVSKSPIEKVYLHLDRDNYVAGETIWFKAYFYSDFYPDTISTTLFAELIAPSNQVILIKTIPIVTGTGRNQFELPDSLPPGNYYVRAYSATMLNHGEDFLFQRSIYVSGKTSPTESATAEKTVHVDFFPEGGNFIAGVANTVAFKITDENGLPVNGSVTVANEAGDMIDATKTYHDGMGAFNIVPAKGMKYYLSLKENTSDTKYALPLALENGIAIKLKPHSQGKIYEIHLPPVAAGETRNPSLVPDYIVGQVQHHVAFTIKLDETKDDISGVLNTKELPSGILQITVFNKEDMPLAERLAFVDNKEYLQQVFLSTDTINFSGKGRNRFDISFPDSVAGSFSIAITDPDYSIEAKRNHTIISSLLMTSDLKGYVHNPAYYFSTSPDSASKGTDLLMMTNGWRRFKWTELPAIATAPMRYRDPGFISFTGKVNQRDTKRPLPDKDLFVMLSGTDDSTQNTVQFMGTDGEGKFKLDSLIFFGKTRFYVSDIGGKNSKWLDIYPDKDSISTSFGLKRFNAKPFTTPASASINNVAVKLGYDYESILKAKGDMLDEVVLKVKRKTPIQELEERYASGMFSSYAPKTIDLTNTNEKIFQNNIFDYIQGRVPGINVLKNEGDYQLIYHNRSSVTQGFIPMVIYLDEAETDARVVATIPANQIAMVKVFSNFLGGNNNNASGGVLAVYTKKGNDITSSLSTSADVFLYRGYSVVKEFYSPDYTPGNANVASIRKDERITLLWQPDVEIAGKNIKVPILFYNNERSKSFKVIVEGITAEGKMVFVEKLIGPATKGF